LAEAIENELDVEVELKSGEHHSFDVLIDDVVIFSKFEEERFPEAEEIIRLIREYQEDE
jgi:selT/selW/selH-like putative selenoprotein